ncbi:hypothetical protein [Sphingopyxis sp.]|nr:hypothetical protein [Sphingopyxis sp.]
MIFDADGAREQADPIKARLDFIEGLISAASAAHAAAKSLMVA